ncbi:kre11p [Saccharomyces arboricola H-6]|uniref:Kre11p n=1 Tax=Saccharomyces arboricola (strain H-6 / AS 2.3317 / CBS 10644) TaxID=1160507 RepID=J8Q7H2_SACAR|nr:kre11p [Saccharomyces arboricola H-6]
MECFVPLHGDLNGNNIEQLRQSHLSRKYIIFDEQLNLWLRFQHDSQSNKRFELQNMTISINEAQVTTTNNINDFFTQVDDTGTLWKLKEDCCSKVLFKSNVVMNNGYNNQIKFQFAYKAMDAELINQNSSQVSHTINTLDKNCSEEILPSFEPVYSWSSMTTKPVNGIGIRVENNTKKVHPDTSKDGETHGADISKTPDTLILKLQYPIYSLLNMRLRNISLKSEHCILSSLDFQTSKASEQLTKKFIYPQKNASLLKLNFREISYKLIEGTSQIELDPICPIKLPFSAFSYDSISATFKLVLLPKSAQPHHVRITLAYELELMHDLKLPVRTSWETEVTLKRSMPISSTSSQYSNTNNINHSTSFNGASNVNAGCMISNLRLGGVSSSRFSLGAASTTSLVNSKLSNVKFKFINNNIKVVKGEKFTMRLQIINSSTSPLDLVVYYNNTINPVPSTTIVRNSNSVNNYGVNNGNILNPPLTLENQYQLYKKYSKIAGGIILLSNDYKIPVVAPKETYFVDLRFIGIMSGYYATLSGLKVLDLNTNELIEVGIGASVLVQ